MANKVTTTIYSNSLGVGQQSKNDVIRTLNDAGKFIGHIDREQRGNCYDILFNYAVCAKTGIRVVQYSLWLIDDREPVVGHGMNFMLAYSNMLNKVRRYEARTRFLRNRERFYLTRQEWQEYLNELA